LQVAGSDGDARGVAECINGIFRMDDALPLMADFSQAEPRVTAAVTTSLAVRHDGAAPAADRARRTPERTVGPSPSAGTLRLD
jgi:hypothetical protein